MLGARLYPAKRFWPPCLELVISCPPFSLCVYMCMRYSCHYYGTDLSLKLIESINEEGTGSFNITSLRLRSSSSSRSSNRRSRPISKMVEIILAVVRSTFTIYRRYDIDFWNLMATRYLGICDCVTLDRISRL
jgi:hypothetical protein